MRNAKAACGVAMLCALGLCASGLAADLPRDPGFAAGVEIGPDAKPDLTVSLKSTDLLKPRQDVTVTVTVTNDGPGPAPRSDCQVFIRNGHAPRQTVRTIKKGVRPLDPGDQYIFSFTVKLELGLYEIAAMADRKNKIAETDEANNKTRILIEGK